MKYHVQWTVKAEQDVERVLRWFHEQSATAAGARWVNQLMARITTLETQPARCALAVEAKQLGSEVRELLFGKRNFKYRILFRIEDSDVHILRVWHGARDFFTVDDV
ncbi:MAG TPA: type II toxin-antitoxin system RelE/ParE family toxin [Pirellulales bacterium]|nr:type II toxin-antitoxin system RelE/ParE family toxin [Pirellulales bacterium]